MSIRPQVGRPAGPPPPIAPEPGRPETPEDLCPITYADMNALPAHELIDAADGRRYAKEGLRGWLKISDVSPLNPQCSLLPDVPRLWAQEPPSAYERACVALTASPVARLVRRPAQAAMGLAVVAEAGLLSLARRRLSRAQHEPQAHRLWYDAQVQDLQGRAQEALADIEHLFVHADPQRWRHLPQRQLRADAIAHVEREMRQEHGLLRLALRQRQGEAQMALEDARGFQRAVALSVLTLACLLGLYVGISYGLRSVARTAEEATSRRVLTPQERALVLARTSSSDDLAP
jgi:hypothetical protein